MSMENVIECQSSMLESRLNTNTTVFVTGAGGVAVPSIIRHLRLNCGYRVLAADMDSYAVGLWYADKGFVVPPGNDPEYLPVMRDICEREHVDVVVPLVDEELLPILGLESAGVTILTPRYQFVRTCLDKSDLMETLTENGISVPATRLAGDYLDDIALPAIVKPRVGRGSRGIGIFDSLSELNYFIECSSYAPSALIVQTYIEGVEYTVSVVVGRDGVVYAVVPKEIVCKRGVTRIAITRRNDKIDELCRKIQYCLHADGPFNVQLVIDKTTGQPIPFEINPRFSTTTTLTAAAGVDEIGGLIDQIVNPDAPRLTNKWKAGVGLLRCSQDEFVDEAYLYDQPITNLRLDDTL